jgi:hypothetical protein
MKNRILCAWLVLIMIPSLALAADSITLTTAVGNPNNASDQLKETGTYTATNYMYILAKARDVNTLQVSSIQATKDQPAQGQWQATLQLVVSNYDCWGELHSRDGQGNEIITSSNTIKNVRVAF